MIRKADTADYAVMDTIFRAAAKAFCSRSYDSQVISSWAGEPSPGRFLKGKDSGDEQYVFSLDGSVVCFGSINLEHHKLVSLFVAPEQSGKGIGQSMLEFLVARAESAGVAVLKVDSSLNAVSFYQRHGFTEISRSLYRTQNGVEMESVQMERNLNL